MDVRAIKLALPTKVAWPPRSPRGFIFFRPLSDAEYDRCLATAARCDAAVAPVVERAELVRASTGLDPSPLYPSQLTWMHRRFEEVQAHAWPNPSTLIEWVRKCVNDHPGVISDGAAAHQCKDAASYYGKPAVDLTRGQLIYYLALRDAYQEFCVGTAKPTNAWLAPDREQRLKWQMSDR